MKFVLSKCHSYRQYLIKRLFFIVKSFLITKTNRYGLSVHSGLVFVKMLLCRHYGVIDGADGADGAGAEDGEGQQQQVAQ